MVTGKEMEEACSGPASARLCGGRDGSKCSECWEARFPRNLERGGTGDPGGDGGAGGYSSSSLCYAPSSESTEEPLAFLKYETGSYEISALRSRTAE